MKPQDIKTPADVARWLQYHCEWSSKASEDMALATIAVLSKQEKKTIEEIMADNNNELTEICSRECSDFERISYESRTHATVEDGEPLGKNLRWRVNHLSSEWYIDKKPLEPDLCMHSQEMHWVNAASNARRCKGDGCECEVRLVGGRWRKQ